MRTWIHSVHCSVPGDSTDEQRHIITHQVTENGEKTVQEEFSRSDGSNTLHHIMEDSDVEQRFRPGFAHGLVSLPRGTAIQPQMYWIGACVCVRGHWRQEPMRANPRFMHVAVTPWARRSAHVNHEELNHLVIGGALAAERTMRDAESVHEKFARYWMQDEHTARAQVESYLSLFEGIVQTICRKNLETARFEVLLEDMAALGSPVVVPTSPAASLLIGVLMVRGLRSDSSKVPDFCVGMQHKPAGGSRPFLVSVQPEGSTVHVAKSGQERTLRIGQVAVARWRGSAIDPFVMGLPTQQVNSGVARGSIEVPRTRALPASVGSPRMEVGERSLSVDVPAVGRDLLPPFDPRAAVRLAAKWIGALGDEDASQLELGLARWLAWVPQSSREVSVPTRSADPLRWTACLVAGGAVGFHSLLLFRPDSSGEALELRRFALPSLSGVAQSTVAQPADLQALDSVSQAPVFLTQDALVWEGAPDLLRELALARLWSIASDWHVSIRCGDVDTPVAFRPNVTLIPTADDTFQRTCALLAEPLGSASPLIRGVLRHPPASRGVRREVSYGAWVARPEYVKLHLMMAQDTGASVLTLATTEEMPELDGWSVVRRERLAAPGAPRPTLSISELCEDLRSGLSTREPGPPLEAHIHLSCLIRHRERRR